MRLEAANIGVLLFCPEQKYLRVRLAPTNRRIDRFFGAEAGDLKQINAMKKMLEHRLTTETEMIRDVEGLRHFAKLLANEIIITEPRATLVEEPNVELAQLYDELVGQFIRTEPATEKVLVDKLRMALDTPRLKAVLRRDVLVKVPVMGNELRVPYAYQNGRLNLIEAHEFNQKREQDLNRDVFARAVLGRLLFKHDDPEAGARQLVIVATFGQAAAPYRQRVEEVLRDHDVAYYPESALPDLERLIAETAH